MVVANWAPLGIWSVCEFFLTVRATCHFWSTVEHMAVVLVADIQHECAVGQLTLREPLKSWCVALILFCGTAEDLDGRSQLVGADKPMPQSHCAVEIASWLVDISGNESF